MCIGKNAKVEAANIVRAELAHTFVHQLAVIFGSQ